MNASANVIVHVLATLGAVIALGLLLSRLLRFGRQPPVIAEMLAGILLGPSCLGLLWPGLAHLLVPPPDEDPNGHVLMSLKVIAQLGIVLYMFLIGLELNAAMLRKSAGLALSISIASTLAPLAFGTLFGLMIAGSFAPESASTATFSAFVGLAMAVTAFPVLARILADCGLQQTPLGVLALGSAAIADLLAWSLLALLLGLAKSSMQGIAVTVAGTVAFLIIVGFVLRPLLVRLCRRYDASERPSLIRTLPWLLLPVLGAAIVTEWLGVHAVFGAFALGVVVPSDSRLARDVTAALKPVVTVLFLPAFFALTGLRTEIGLLTSATHWLLVPAFVLVAILGKFGGTFLTARRFGTGDRTAAALGVMMSTHGLMTLIILEIGLSLGVITPTVFTIMVLMALTTTMMAGPMLHGLNAAPELMPYDPPDGDSTAPIAARKSASAR